MSKITEVTLGCVSRVKQPCLPCFKSLEKSSRVLPRRKDPPTTVTRATTSRSTTLQPSSSFPPSPFRPPRLFRPVMQRPPLRCCSNTWLQGAVPAGTTRTEPAPTKSSRRRRTLHTAQRRPSTLLSLRRRVH